MAIVVKYFARLREQLGREEEHLEAEGLHTVSEVWHRVSGGQPLPPNVLMAVNCEYAQANGNVRDGDEVAFFPPVTGG